MANRNFNRFQALEKEVKALYAEVSIAGSGAPTLVRGLGVASIVRDSAGLYTITLQDKYNRLMNVSVAHVAAAPATLIPQVAAEDVDNARTVQIRFVDAADTEVDPANGDRLLIRIDVKNSSI